MQVYKLETEAANLQSDYDAYNAIQDEFKLAPAYKKVCTIDIYIYIKLKRMKYLDMLLILVHILLIFFFEEVHILLIF